jgi:hypothetical protein
MSYLDQMSIGIETENPGIEGDAPGTVVDGENDMLEFEGHRDLRKPSVANAILPCVHRSNESA